jgi:hypothetical protein
MHSMSRELAIAGIGANTASSAVTKSSGGSAALRTLIKQECDQKVDKERLEELL